MCTRQLGSEQKIFLRAKIFPSEICININIKISFLLPLTTKTLLLIQIDPKRSFVIARNDGNSTPNVGIARRLVRLSSDIMCLMVLAQVSYLQYGQNMMLGRQWLQHSWQSGCYRDKRSAVRPIDVFHDLSLVGTFNLIFFWTQVFFNLEAHLQKKKF